MEKDIEQALKECREAFALNQAATSVWCCHHEILWEPLTEPYEKRISYILSSKPKSEHLLRFKNFRPCSTHDIVAPLDKDYNEKCALLDKDYNEKRAPLDKDYSEKCAPLDKDYNEKCALLDKDYSEKRAPLDKDYSEKCAPLDKDYNEKCALLDKDYSEKCALLYKNDVPLGTWNGKSIFNNQ